MNIDGQTKNAIRFMLLLASFCSLVLLFTRAAIGERAELSLRSVDAILQIVGTEILPVEEQLLGIFNTMFIKRSGGRVKFWQGSSRPDIWACEATGNGMWAEITLVFVFDASQRKMLGMRVTEQNETPGLGSLICEEAFYDQFEGLNAADGLKMAQTRVIDNQFDAVTGATVSSRAVETILNKALQALQQFRSLS
jgi:Na+-translocating ferredoxin:NAD+ oxidoreductase RnfG subunit